MSKSQENYKTHTILKPEDCKCDRNRCCSVCDGGLSFCTVCKGGESELEEQSCEERTADNLVRDIVRRPWEYACSWYKTDDIHRSLTQKSSFGEPSHESIPKDTSSREFAEWLANEYRHAMRKGAEIATNEFKDFIERHDGWAAKKELLHWLDCEVRDSPDATVHVIWQQHPSTLAGHAFVDGSKTSVCKRVSKTTGEPSQPGPFPCSRCVAGLKKLDVVVMSR